MERPPGERFTELERLCGHEPTLHDELEELIEAAAEAGDFMEASAAVDIDALPRPEATPTRCGAYELLRPIGQGGSGTVYLAARADDVYSRKVAVKVTRRGRADRDLLHRFFNERQILASLDHPHIAELFDGGSTQDGLPYFVMEHVDGLPIHEYCDRRRLSLEERLELFCKVCDAVAHAHQKLVVHRDIKPSNILVTEEGVPKLLDFGIAKLLDPELVSWDLAATATWNRPFTPHYASPEQIQGKLVTTRSDVYSLGVLLYQLLTGRLPYRLEGRSLGDVGRLVAEVEPPPPSAAVSEPDAAEDAARNLRLRAERLRSRLTGDLDTIVLTALRKDPQRRYSSVEQLTADIRRHLTGRPVLARKDTWTYRLGKFIRRNRIMVGLVGLFLIVVAVLIASLSVQTVRLARERDQARRESDRSTRVLELMQEVLSTADPFDSGDREPTVGEILERATAKLEELEDQREIQVALMTSLGLIYLERGEYSRSESLLARALLIRRQVLQEENADTTENMGSLGIALRRLGRYDEAERLQREALVLRRRIFGDDSVEVALSYNDLAVVLRNQGRYAEAEELYRRALSRYRKALGEEHVEVATSLHNLGLVLGYQEKLDEAERLHREALEMRLKLLGPSHLYTAFSQVNLSHILLLKKDWRRAEPYLDQGSSRLREILGDAHPEVLRSRFIRASLFKTKGDPPEAERLLRELRSQAREIYGEHPAVAWVLAELADVRRLRGDYGEAERLARQALDMRRELLGGDHPDTTASLENLARILRLRGELEAAEPR